MVPTFILTRTFLISALFVGALPVSYTAPVPHSVLSSPISLPPRSCRQMGCLFASPTEKSDDANSTTSLTLNTPPEGFSADALQVIDFIISALTTARSAATSATTETVLAVESSNVDPVTVDGFVDPVTGIAEELESSSTEGTVAEREVPPSASLDVFD